jgi:predicted house-cleaning noncanonical NTP pyrophosphatase (MazG superfamily)
MPEGKIVKHNKLVRDKIPDIIKSKGEKPVFHSLNEIEVMGALRKKLAEEAKELAELGHEPRFRSHMIEELADFKEVYLAVLAAYHFSEREVERVRLKKLDERGGFSQRIFLEYVES